jgi:aminomethyltransferase
MSMKNTALFHFHEKSGAKLVDFAGFRMPLYYSNIIEEHMAVRKCAGIFDVSHMGKVILKGKECEEFLLKVLSNSVAKEKVGNAVYTHILNEDGNIIDDMILYKLRPDLYYTIPNASKTEQIKSWFQKNMNSMGISLSMKDVTKEMVCLALQGPKAAETLQRIISGFDLKEIKFFRFKIFEYFNKVSNNGSGDRQNCQLTLTEQPFPGESTVLVSRTGYTGEDGFEIIADNDVGIKLWNSIMEAGKEFGIKPIGLGARDTLRLEKGFLLSGTDFNEDRTTLETNWTFAIDWDHDFIGRGPMQEQNNVGTHDLLVGVEMKGSGIPRHGYELYIGAEKVGTFTSGTMSPSLKKGIGLAYVKRTYAEPGTKLEIDIRGKRVEAEVIKLPFV